MKSPRYKVWTVVSFAALIGGCVLSIALVNDIRLISVLVLPPLIAGLTTTPRRTGLISALSIAAAFALAIPFNSELFSTSHALRIAVVILAAALAVQTAILRERDLRTRRRLVLINAARDQLDAASGIEESLSSFCRAATTAEFAEWAILDVRLPDGETIRVVESAEAANELEVVVREQPTSASASFELEVQRGGPLLLRKAPAALVEGLFAGADVSRLKQVNMIINHVSVGELTAVFYLICPNPHPPWGEAEVTQVASLARAAAQRARSDQLIDKITHAQQELSASRDEVQAIVGGIASGIIAQRPDGGIVYANDVAARLLDWGSAAELIGSNFSAVLDRLILRHEDGRPFKAEDVPSRRALRGDREPTALFRYIIKSSGEERWMFVRSTAILDANGDPVLAIAVIEDNTDRKRSEVSQAFLANASAMLSESLNHESAIRAIASAAVPAIADWCTIEMVGRHGKIETVEVAHADPDLTARVRKFCEDFPVDPAAEYGAALAIRTGVGQLYEKVDMEAFRHFYDDEAQAQSAAELSPRSSMTAPIVVRGEPIGAISLALTRAGARYTNYDLDTVVELGRRAGTVLDNTRMHTERMRMLASLQQSLIPAELPSLEGLSLSATFRPAERDAEVGGDFYDAFTLADGSSALVIGDVCGKGPEAAALTALARYTIRTTAMTESDPQRILTRLNEALLDQVRDGRFCTVAFARLAPDGDDFLLETVAAGHPLPLVVGSQSPKSVGEPGTLLGVVPDPVLPITRTTLKREEALMLYTDGLSAGQTTDDTEYALELVSRLNLNGSPDLAAVINRAAIDLQAEPNRDDVAILVARVG